MPPVRNDISHNRESLLEYASMDTPSVPDPKHRSIEMAVNPLRQPTPRKVLVGSHYDGFHAPGVSKRDTNVALIWSLALLFLFASFLASALFYIIESGQALERIKVLDDSISEVTTALETVTMGAETQAYAVASIAQNIRSRRTNSTVPESMSILEELHFLMKSHPGPSGPNFISSVVGYHTIHQSGVITGIEREDNICKKQKGPYWCFGSDPLFGNGRRPDVIVSSVCTDNCSHDFPPREDVFCQKGQLCSPATTAEQYTYDYLKVYASHGFFTVNNSLGIVRWMEATTEILDSFTETYVTVVVQGLNPLVQTSANRHMEYVDCLGGVDMTFSSLTKVFSQLARKMIPTDFHEEFVIAPIVIGVLEIRKKNNSSNIVTPILTSYLNTNASKEKLKRSRPDQVLENFFLSVESNFSYGDHIALRLEGNIQGTKDPQILSCRTRKFARPGFHNFHWLAIVCANDHLTLGTRDSVMEYFLIFVSGFIIVTVLCLASLQRAVMSLFSGNSLSAVATFYWKKMIGAVLNIRWVSHSLIPITAATLIPSFLLLLYGEFVDPNVFLFRVSIWAIAKFPIVYWLYQAFLKTGGDLSKKKLVCGKHRFSSDKTFAAALFLWWVVRSLSISLDKYGAIHVFGDGGNIRNQPNVGVLKVLSAFDCTVVLVLLRFFWWQRLSVADSCRMKCCSRIFPTMVLVAILVFLGFQIVSLYVLSSDDTKSSVYFLYPVGIFVFLFPAAIMRFVKDKRFPPLSSPYRVIMSIFYLWMNDWICALMANVLAQLRLLLDSHQLQRTSHLPVIPCDGVVVYHHCQESAIESVTIVMAIWVTISMALGYILEQIAWRAVGFELTLASSFGVKIMRSIFSGLFFHLLRPFSSEFIVFTMLEIGGQIISCSRLQWELIQWLKNSNANKRKKENSDFLVRTMAELEDALIKNDEEAGLLLRRMAKGIYYIHAYSLSRLVMIVIIIFSDLFESSRNRENNGRLYTNDVVLNHKLRYLASYLFQLALNCIATRLVHEWHTYKIKTHHDEHAALKRELDTARKMKDSMSPKNGPSGHRPRLRRLADELLKSFKMRQGGHQYDVENNISVEEMTAHITPLTCVMAVFGVCQALLSYSASYRFMIIDKHLKQSEPLSSLVWIRETFAYTSPDGRRFGSCFCKLPSYQVGKT